MPVIYPVTIVYLLGILASQFLLAPMWMSGPAAAALILFSAAARGRERLFMGFLLGAVFLCSMFLYGVNEAVYRMSPLADYLETRKDQERLEQVYGTVVNVREAEDGRVFLTVQVEEVRWKANKRLRAPGRISLRFPEDAASIPSIPKYGERWAFEGALRPVSGMKPGAREYYRMDGVVARMSIARQGVRERIGRGEERGLMRIGSLLRDRFIAVLEKNIASPYNQVVGRMVLGKGKEMDPDLYEAFRRSGLMHVLVVSGMNVWIMLSTFIFLGFLWNRRPVFSFGVLSAVLILYYAITGGGPTVIRATLMGFIFLIALLRGAEYTARTALFTAGLMVMVMDPLIVFNVGAQLTFLASAGVIFVYTALAAFVPMRVWWGRPLKVLLISMGAQLPIYPVLAYYFNRFCVVSPLSNLFVVPLAGVLLPVGFLTCVVGMIPGKIVAVPAFAAELIARLIVFLTRFFAGLPFSNIEVASPSLQWMAVYGMGLALFVWTLRRMKDGTDRQIVSGWLGVALIGVLLIAGPAWRAPLRDMQVTFMDVGEGDSVLIEAPAKSRGGRIFRALVDGGGTWGDDAGYYDPGERVVGRRLRQRGVRRLDMVILSHPDADHMNGLLWVMKNIRVDRFLDTALPSETACRLTGDGRVCRGAAGFGKVAELTPNQKERYAELLKIVKKKGIEYVFLEGGMVFGLPSGLEIRVLSPDSEWRGMEHANRNDLSAAMKISYGAGSVLMTGDIENETEGRLVRRYGGMLKSDLLKAPHHGSGSSSSRLFLGWARPSAVVISTGGPRYYGNPESGVLSAYRRMGMRIYRTDLNGTVVCMLNRAGGVRCRPQYFSE